MENLSLIHICAGCAETAYARLVTQVCGDRRYISNATGCYSIWGGPAATSPYTVNKEGKGPAWANSCLLYTSRCV